jgi:dihydroorotate dehydrogenase
MMYEKIAKPLLFKKDAEEAHEMAISIAKKTSSSAFLQTIASFIYGASNRGLGKEIAGLHFPNPIGLAAGFDKNGVSPKAMQALGFGFVEIGSITAKASQGNPKPRAFRLPQDQSLINRMGLNNEGAEAVIRRLKKVRVSIPLGINIAKTNDAGIHGEEAINDYLMSYKWAQQVADYITINISCPNTGEGKTFEDPDALHALLHTLKPHFSSDIPSFVKFSVDTDKSTLEKLIEICEQVGISGYVATNTSSDRSSLTTSTLELEQIGNGGLSGQGIRAKSTQVVRWISECVPDKPLVGVGGIDSAEAAAEKFEAGADLIQLYTALVFKGPSLVRDIKKKLT